MSRRLGKCEASAGPTSPYIVVVILESMYLKFGHYCNMIRLLSARLLHSGSPHLLLQKVVVGI
jgi:hypothetical protein